MPTLAELMAEVNRNIAGAMHIPAGMLRERPQSTAAQLAVQMRIAGMRIIVSDLALEVTAIRLFPLSKHRSARVHKKLVKRFGGEFKRVPCIWQTPAGLICHPAMYERLKREVDARNGH